MPCHGYMPCDSCFTAIKKRKRRYNKIYLPSEYAKMITKSGIKFEMVTPNQNMLLNFKKSCIILTRSSNDTQIFRSFLANKNCKNS